MAVLRTGTSGYAYKEWKGGFYPEKLPQTRFLEYYSGQLGTVEINNTFYRFPGETMLHRWLGQTPDGFCFAIKGLQKITHHARLADVGPLTHDFVERCRLLHHKLGPILFQLPPNLKRDDSLLRDFMETLPRDVRATIEFRHGSWFHDTVMTLLVDFGTALCVSQGDTLEPPRIATAPFTYVRLRKDHYDAAELGDWRQWISQRLAEDRDVYVYLKHDGTGESAKTALDLLKS